MAGLEAVRKFYLDNLRNLAILLLFPFHTLMIWNDFGPRFYVWDYGSRLASTLLVLVNPWFMPLLFVIAGISARFSLAKRGTRRFLAERARKLLVPFLSGLVLLVPVQTLFARKWFFAYSGSYPDNLKYFFTHLTDFSGYDGCFSPGQLWFILFLLIVSAAFVPLEKFLPYEKARKHLDRMNAWGIVALFVPVTLLYFVGNFGGFSLGKSFALFAAGYYVLSGEGAMRTLWQSRKLVLSLFGLSQGILAALYYRLGYYGDILVNFTGWTGILAMLVLGGRHLDKSTALTEYLGGASFSLYIFHQSILVAVAYHVLPLGLPVPCEILIVAALSLGLSVLAYEAARRIPLLRALFGIRKGRARPASAGRLE